MTDRRSDLDALRGTAMVLGIVLHTCASFFGFPWSIHEQQSNTVLAILCIWIHSFRMPLFFILSGFFTQLVAEQRGLKKLVQQRFERIVIPLVLASLCILPINNYVSQRVNASRHREPVIEAIVRGENESLQSWLRSGGDINHQDGVFARSLVAWASLSNNVGALQILADRNANLHEQDPTGNTPLHFAVFFGSSDAFEFLIEHGADPGVKNRDSHDSLESLASSSFRASSISGVIGLLANRSPEELRHGRERIRSYVSQHQEKFKPLSIDTAKRRNRDWVSSYWQARSSDRFAIQIGKNSWHLFDTVFFDHLWFLSFLVWLLSIYVALISMRWKPTLHHCCYALACILAGQYFMGAFGASFGPDTELGFLPAPHLLTYYAGFFFLGAIMKCSKSMQRWIETQWWWMLLAALLLFPIALATIYQRSIALFVQPMLALGMSFGSIGLFQYYVKTPSIKLRWLADSSYWLYLAHIPIVIMAQFLVTSWSIPGWAKFLFVLAISHLILLVSYQWLVRYTWIGRLLHGPKQPSNHISSHLTAKPS